MNDGMSALAFAKWWLKTKPFEPPLSAQLRVGAISGTVLFRRGQYQVEQFVAEPFAEAPSHYHPNIDTIEYIVSGSLVFDQSSGRACQPGDRVRVRPGEVHVARAGADGVCFISMQRWLNDVPPTSVTLDWVGAPIDANHGKSLCN